MANLNPVDVFDQVKGKALAAIATHFPFVGRLHRLDLLSLEAMDDADKPSSKFHIDNIESQYESKVVGGTWAIPIRAKLRLVEIATEKVLDESTITLARLPKITRRYTYIIDGNERQHDNTFRLKARPYHLTSAKGEVVARWNLSKGMGFDLVIPKGTRKLQMKFGMAHIPLYPILKTLGVADADMETAWGKEIFAENKTDTFKDLAKIHKTLTAKGSKTYKPPPPEELQKFVADYFDSTRTRPEAMEAAFGKPFDRVNGENLLLSSNRIIGIHRGTEPEDDRQSLSSKDIASTEDYIAEYIEKRAREITMKVKNNLDKKEKISEIMSSGAYSHVIKSSFEYAQRPEQTNPLTFVTGHLRTTIKGEMGGIKGAHTIVETDQLINPSHLGFLDSVATPESSDVGISLHLSLGARKDGKDLKISVYDMQTKSIVEVSPGVMERANVAYPDQVTWKNGVPSPVTPNVVVYDSLRQTNRRPWKDVRYVLLSSKGLFTFSTNLIPFLQNDQGNRAMMASKHMEQAVSLVYREAPLVQTKSESAHSFEEVMGAISAHHSPIDGVIEKVGKHDIHIRNADGVAKVSLYHHFPLNGAKTMLHSEALVAVGDKVKAGQPIADTNYSKNGVLALGKNIRVAYVPYAGLTFEDGIVISQTASKEFTAMQLHVETLYVFPGMILNRKRWTDYAVPEKATPGRVAKLDENGLIREGQKVSKGDILVAALSPAKPTKEEQMLGTIHRSLLKDLKDSSLVWDHDYPGKVVKVVQTGDRVVVHIRTDEPAGVGDKLAGRHGNKGIISRILPDSEMPHDKEGRPVHVLLNPAGVVSRMNVGTVLEVAASKIAEKTGKPYLTDNFTPGVDYAQKVTDELKKHGLSESEELFDAKTGKSLGPILVGKAYLMQLHHQVDKKMTARSYGGAYTPHGAPISGSGVPGGGQTMDQLTTYAMLAHGSSANLREAFTVKSDVDQNEVWAAIQTGRQLPAPRSARVLQHFIQYMKGMGANVEKQGDQYVLSPMTDKQTLSISNGTVKFPDKLLKAKGALTMEEVGGLFDKKVTGGLEGQYFSHMELAERMPNPMFEGPIRALLGLKEHEFEQYVGPSLIGGKSGFKIISEKLKEIDTEKELKKVEKELATAKGPKLSQAYHKVRYLRSLKELGISALDAYTNKVLPVVPPSIRRVSIGLDGKQIFDDLNGLYAAAGMINGQIKKADPATPTPEMQKLRSSLYDSIRALRISGMDMGEGVKKRHHRGLMELMKGTTPKTSFWQDHVMSRRQDLSGRSTIIPLPELGLDEVGLPVPVAMEMYKPFVVRELHTQRGYSPLDAQKLVQKKDPVAMEALKRVIQNHPVLFKRDPALHKFSIMAFNPVLTPGKAIGMHPLATAGAGADFDGNCFVGESKVVVKVTDSRYREGDTEGVALKFAEDTKILCSDLESTVVEIQLKDIPYLEETHRFDKNGASVYDLPPGWFVLSYDHATGAPLFADVTAITIEEDCEVTTVRTRKGFEVTASTNESLCVYDYETGEVRDCAPEDAVGRFSPIVKKVPAFHFTKASAIEASEYLAAAPDMKDDRDIVPVPHHLMLLGASTLGPCKSDMPLVRSLVTRKSAGKMAPSVSRDTALRMLALFRKAGSLGVDAWERLVLSEDIHWDLIEEQIPVGRERVYDLIVPQTKVFAVNGGLIVWDTMALYLPISVEAKEEAKKMLPSHNLFSPTHGGLMNVPAQDSLLGLHQASAWGKIIKAPATVAEATKLMHDGKVEASDSFTLNGKATTIGRWVLSQYLPPAMQQNERLLHDPTFRLDSGGLTALLTEVAKKHPLDYAKTVDAWKDIGDKLSYFNGSSFSIKDYHDGHVFRDEILKPYRVKEATILASKGSQSEKDAKVIDLYRQASVEIEKRGQERYKKLGTNRVFDWISAGARGKWEQFGQLVMGPILVSGSRGVVIPMPITKSYGEGLPLSEYLASMHGARKGAIDRAVGTSAPGAMAKTIANTVIDMQIASHDCGTIKGVSIATDEPDMEGRYTAQPIHLKTGELPARTLLTPAILAEMRKEGVHKIIVRSPLQCLEKNGICSTCHGLDEFGKHPNVGVNIGIIAGQALAEPVTQLAMKSRHTGGKVEAKANMYDSFKRIQQLFDVPKTLPNSATLALVSGTVESVRKDAALGGHEIFINGKRHMVPAQLDVLPGIHHGAEVKKGDPLSNGPINPQELLKLTKNMNAVRQYLTDEISNTYGAKKVKRRNIETVVRAMTNVTHIDHAPGHPEYLRGQYVPLSEIDHANRLAKEEGREQIMHTPVLKSMKEMPLSGREDWMGRLNYAKLENTFREGAAQSWRSDIHGSVIGGLAHGAEFGAKPPVTGAKK